jgi:hypothetical protein
VTIVGAGPAGAIADDMKTEASNRKIDMMPAMMAKLKKGFTNIYL